MWEEKGEKADVESGHFAWHFLVFFFHENTSKAVLGGLLCIAKEPLIDTPWRSRTRRTISWSWS